MEGYGCGTDALSAKEMRMEFHQLHVESSCLMLHGGFLLGNSWNLASQVMLLLTVLQVVVTHFKEIAFASTGI